MIQPDASPRCAALVLEIEFPATLPSLYDALRIRDGDRNTILEVAYHLDAHNIRAIAMSHTEG